MDTEVARTLVELERKLIELERALTSIGTREPEGAPTQPEPNERAYAADARAVGARLVDEDLDSSAGRASPPPQAAASGSSPAGSDESIELAELASFRDRLERTMRELVADYERIIRLRGAGQRPPAGES